MFIKPVTENRQVWSHQPVFVLSSIKQKVYSGDGGNIKAIAIYGLHTHDRLTHEHCFGCQRQVWHSGQVPGFGLPTSQKQMAAWWYCNDIVSEWGYSSGIILVHLYGALVLRNGTCYNGSSLMTGWKAHQPSFHADRTSHNLWRQIPSSKMKPKLTIIKFAQTVKHLKGYITISQPSPRVPHEPVGWWYEIPKYQAGTPYFRLSAYHTSCDAGWSFCPEWWWIRFKLHW